MKNRKNNTRLILLLLIICITLGYAALRTGLNINGTTNVSSASWNVYFSNYQMSNATNITPTEEPEIVGTTTTSISYEVDLEEPGDLYEFSVEVVNGGSIDALISLISKYNGSEIGPSNPVPEYIEYAVTDENGDEIVDGHRLNHGNREIVKVLVKYKDDDPSILPSSGTSLSFDIEIEATQAGKVNPPVVNDLYTVNVEEGINIGNSMPTHITTYQTPAEAMAAFNNRPIYLKHTIDGSIWVLCYYSDGFYCIEDSFSSQSECEEYKEEHYPYDDFICDNPVEESYVNIVINDTTKAQLKANICYGSSSCETAIDNLVNGTYYIDGNNENEELYNEKVNLIKSIYNYAVQDDVCDGFDYGYECNIEGFEISIDTRGTSTIKVGGAECVAGGIGSTSICNTY